MAVCTARTLDAAYAVIPCIRSSSLLCDIPDPTLDASTRTKPACSSLGQALP